MRKKPGTPPQGGTPTPPPKPEPGSGFHLPEEPQALEESAPVSPSSHLLNPAHQRFCQEYLHDLNATQAYLRVYPSSTNESAQTNAWRLIGNEGIRKEIQRLLDERAIVTGITTDRVLIDIFQRAMADTRELVDVRVGSCRHCHGWEHQYQYTDREWDRAISAHAAEQKKLRKLAEKQGTTFEPADCPPKGGTGYTPNRPPNPDCPECHGDGTPRSIIRDLRHASPGALAMFGGIKYDKAGNMSVIVRDPAPFVKMLAEHVGLLTGEKVATASDPLAALLEEIRGAHGAGSALQIVHEDPERRSPGPDVQDVQPKAQKPEPGSGSPPTPRKTWRPSR